MPQETGAEAGGPTASDPGVGQEPVARDQEPNPKDSALTIQDARLRAQHEKIGLVFFWLLVLAYGFFIPSIINWNTESHLYPAFALVDHGTLRIDRYQQGLGDKSYWQGHWYSDKAPGLAFLAVPVYAGLRALVPSAKVEGFKLYKNIASYYYIPRDQTYLRYAITYILVALPSAALAILLWLFLAKLSGSTGWPLAIAAVYALGTPAYVFSIWYFSHQICAVLLFCAFLLLYYWVRHRQAQQTVYLAAAGAGLLTGYSIISEYPTIVIAAALGIYLLAVARRRRLTAIAFVGGMVPPALLNLGYNLVAFGRPFATGYDYVHSDVYHVHVSTGPLGFANPFSYAIQAPTLDSIWQITFGAYRGIFVISPILLLFFGGIFFMWRRRDLRPEWWLCLGIVIAYFLVDASRGADTNGWSGGSSVASRHLVPMLPFMMVPMVFGLRNQTYRVAFVVLGAISVALMFMTVSSTYLFPFTDKNPIMNEVLPDFFHGQVLPNWIFVWRDVTHLTGDDSLLPFLAVVGLLAARIVWLLRAGRLDVWAQSGLASGSSTEAG